MEVASAIVGPVVTVLTDHIKQKLGYLTSYAEHVEHMKNRMKVLEDQNADIERLKRQHPNMPAHVPGWLEEVKKIKEDVDNIPSNNIGCFSVKKKFLAGRNALRHTKVIEGLIGDGSKMISDDTLWREAEGYSYADRVKEMKDKMKVLEGHRVDNENHLRRNRESNLEIPERVDGWLKDAKKIKEDVENDGCFDLEKKMRRNNENNREIPDRLPESLEEVEEEVEKITEDADNITTNNDALKHIKDIDRLIKESSEIEWSDGHIGLGRVDSKRLASTSGGGTQNLFKSREKTFNEALKLLQQNDDDAARVIALCGMGGVGKTTLMNDLKEVAKNEKMFNCIVKAVIGNTPNLLDIQKVIAADTGEPLTETNETLRATLLSKRFNKLSEKKETCLVILDDVWERINLEDIGLASPLPKGVKLLLTSREERICHQIAVDAKCVLKPVRVDVLEEEEARGFFCQIAEISAEHDRDLYDIGCKIVKKCGCLPLAIKIIAADVICEKKRSVWKHKLKSLEKNNDVLNIVDMSYKNLEREDKAIFLLCGLFPEDSNIPIEDLTRYAWGLKLLEQVSTMEDARDSTETSVSKLKNKYLLMDGDSRDTECVKMHDIVLAFVVVTVSKGGEDGCSIIHHEDDFSNSSEANSMSQSCKRISLTCKDMSKFPSDLRFPNLSLLKLMHGDESLRFPQDFYEGKQKLQVIAFEKLEYPPVPTSFQCANLRTLCLDECSLIFDLTCIGNLSNLEVLSIANSRITILPSTFGNLKELRLLDVTGCYNLVIDDGVLGSLEKIEELYMRSFDGHAVCFTDNNCSELAERSKKLCALEFEFIGNNDHMKNMSYAKLKRFKLSVGRYFTEGRWLHRSQGEAHSYQNSLKLVTNREEILKSKINELFKITHALYLQVNDMNTLEDVDVEFPRSLHPSRNCSFYKLRILVVSECAELKYLFTPSVATSLSKLEYLEIYGCLKMEAVIHTENYVDVFSNLKYLRLAKVPELLHFCNKVDVIELPRLMVLQLEGLPKITSIYWSSDISSMQSLFNKEDTTPKLQKLVLLDMENLKEIWPPQFSISNLCPLRELTVKGCTSIEVLFNMDFVENEQLSSSLRSITVEGCDSLVKLFSCNPFPYLNNLQELNVKSCGSIQVLFNTDLGRAGKSEEQVCSSSLRSIKVWGCDSLVNLLPSNPMPLFNNLEELEVRWCASIEVIFNIDMGCVGEMDKVSSNRLRSIHLEKLGKLREVWRIKDAGNNLIRGFEAVESIDIRGCDRFENLITPTTTTFDMRALKEVKIYRCGRESERKDELVESNQDLEIDVVYMPGKESNDNVPKVALPFYLFPTFHHLHNLYLLDYKAVEVVFEITTPSTRESPHNTQQPPILPYLEELWLNKLDRMSHVWKCNWNDFLILQKPESQSSFHNLTTITMYNCNNIKYLFSPLMAKLLSNLKKVEIWSCDGIEEVVLNIDDEDASIYSHINTGLFPHLDILFLSSLKKLKCIGGSANGISTDIHDQLKSSQASWSWSLCQNAREISIKNCDALSSVIPWYAVGQMQKLQVLKIQGCNLLEQIFTFSTLESLTHLEELEVEDCKGMEVIITEDNGEQITASFLVVFPHLKSLKLVNLPNFVGFFLGKNEIRWPALEKVVIRECPQIAVFTYGQSTTPKLNFINTSLGKHSVECGLNFRVTTTSHQARLPSYESTSSYRPTTMERLPWSYHNLIEVDMDMDYKPSAGHTLFSSDKLLQLQKLETLHFRRCEDIEQIFDSQIVAEIPNLRQVDLEWLAGLKYIWKSKQGTVLKFPNLTRLSITGCNSLVYVFTCSMVGSMSQLQELHISDCKRMKVIVKGEEEECDAIVNAIVEFPCLKSLKLYCLQSLEGFWLGKEAFEFPSLDTLQIDGCPEMTVFTKGDLYAPKLYAIRTWDMINGKRKYNIHNRLNSFFSTENKRD